VRNYGRSRSPSIALSDPSKESRRSARTLLHSLYIRACSPTELLLVFGESKIIDGDFDSEAKHIISRYMNRRIKAGRSPKYALPKTRNIINLVKSTLLNILRKAE